MQGSPSSRRWLHRLPLRLSVRSLLVLVLLVGATLGLIVHRARVQRDAVAAIERAGGGVMYEWQFKDGIPNREGTPRVPKWLVDLVGVDYFGSAVYVIFIRECRDQDLAQIGRLRRLERLDIGHSRVTDAGLAHLEGLNRLQLLDLAGTPISDRGLVHLGRLTGLEILYLNFTTVGDTGLAHLKDLGKLQSLDLGTTNVTDGGLAHLKGLSNLRALTLIECPVGDEGLAHLENLTRLEWLGLGRLDVTEFTERSRMRGPNGFTRDIPSDARVTDAGLRHLKKMSRLRRLYLVGTEVTDAGVRELQQALPKVDIEH